MAEWKEHLVRGFLGAVLAFAAEIARHLIEMGNHAQSSFLMERDPPREPEGRKESE